MYSINAVGPDGFKATVDRLLRVGKAVTK